MVAWHFLHFYAGMQPTDPSQSIFGVFESERPGRSAIPVQQFHIPKRELFKEFRRSLRQLTMNIAPAPDTRLFQQGFVFEEPGFLWLV